MKTEMTEKVARETLARLLTSQHAPYPWEALPDLQWEAIKKAWGLEFAPEPALPERLGVDMRGFIQPEDRAIAGMMGWVDEDQRLAGNAAARDRYNAYPPLRRAAQALVNAIIEESPERKRPLHDRVSACVWNLRCELDRGPK